MPSKYRLDSRNYPYDASMANLQKARASARYHPPRPWRSKEESSVVRLFVYWWLTSRDRNKPSGRAWARELGVSHTWLQKLVREFQKDPNQIIQRACRAGDPTLAQLDLAREFTRQ